METTKKLVMNFKTTGDKKISISVDNPKEDITESEIRSVMTLILSSNIFLPNGDELAALVDARIIETDTTSYDLVI